MALRTWPIMSYWRLLRLCPFEFLSLPVLRCRCDSILFSETDGL